MKVKRQMLLLRIAAVAALIALAMMVWSFVDPRPITMMVVMTVGQALGTLSLLFFLAVVGWDLIGKRLAKKKAAVDASPAEPDEEGGA